MNAVDLEDKLKAKKIIQDYFGDRKDIAVVYLFGSTVSARLLEQSDVDIGVLYKPDCIPDMMQRLQEQTELSGLLQREVDLVTLNQASPILGYQVLKYGECILKPDQRAANQFFVCTLNEYFDLKMCRRVIEQSLSSLRIL